MVSSKWEELIVFIRYPLLVCIIGAITVNQQIIRYSDKV
jgi:hypothetical protein